VIVLLYGANELALKRRLTELKEQADGGSGMLESNLNAVDGRDAKPNDILGPAMSVPFLSARRLVLVEHFLERFERRGGQASPRSVEPFEPLFAGLEAGIPDTTLLVFFGQPFLAPGGLKSSVTKANPMVAALAKRTGASNEEKPELKGAALVDAIRDEARQRGVQLRPGHLKDRLLPGEVMPEEADPAKLIANLVQGDMLSVANELDKLALYSNGNDVSVVEVNRVCAGERIATGFEFVDAVMDGDLGKSLEDISRLKRDGETLHAILASLFNGYRRAASILDLLDARATPEKIGKSMGPAGKWPNLRDAAIRRARNLGHDGLKAAYQAMVEADRTDKLGEVDNEVGFDILIMRLTALTARGGHAGTRR
jgi:DNA polymerase III delta subunit